MPTRPFQDSADRYNAIPYPGWPRLETHPDRLAAIAMLHGMKPAPVERCRVLEVGCGDGENVVSMAYGLPDSRFVAVDTAAGPLRRARQTARAIGLRNLRLVHVDLRNIDRSWGQFDYIIAHGLYSWVPEPVRDALLALCGRMLAANGVSFVSYNVYPGRHIRQMLREVMLHHGGGVENALELLEFLRANAILAAPWRDLLEHEIDEILSREPASLFHDDLAPVNQPVYFHEFITHAGRHGLQYLGDAHVHETVDHQRRLGGNRDRLVREQYLDFLKLRRFRQTLLCRSGARLNREPSARHIGRLSFSSPARVDGDFLEGANRVRIRRGDSSVDAIAQALREAWPRPVPFRDVRGCEGAREILYHFCLGGFAEPHAWPFPAALTPGDRPRASALARHQLRSSYYVTNLCHRTLHVDARIASLLSLLDGSRDRPALPREWAAAAGGPSARAARRELDPMLEWMARMALLVDAPATADKRSLNTRR